MMVRSRLATLALAGTLGLASGCTCFTERLSERPLLSRLFGRNSHNGECVESASPVYDGSMMDNSGPVLMAPSTCAPMAPQQNMPLLASPPRRFVPEAQPQFSQPQSSGPQQ